MSKSTIRVNASAADSTPVSFGEHFTRSDQFDRIFKEGMALVERTAAYLDGTGRAEAKKLKPPVNVAYATESMRLTTRLLELASWLLIRRALKNGEISQQEAERKRARIKIGGESRPSHIRNWAELPQGLRELIELSYQLGDRITQLDRGLTQSPAAAPPAPVNPVASQQAALETAFAGRPRLVVGH